MMPRLKLHTPEAILEAADIANITEKEIVVLRNPRPYQVTESTKSVCGWDIEFTFTFIDGEWVCNEREMTPPMMF